MPPPKTARPQHQQQQSNKEADADGGRDEDKKMDREVCPPANSPRTVPQHRSLQLQRHLQQHHLSPSTPHARRQRARSSVSEESDIVSSCDEDEEFLSAQSDLSSDEDVGSTTSAASRPKLIESDDDEDIDDGDDSEGSTTADHSFTQHQLPVADEGSTATNAKGSSSSRKIDNTIDETGQKAPVAPPRKRRSEILKPSEQDTPTLPPPLPTDANSSASHVNASQPARSPNSSPSSSSSSPAGRNRLRKGSHRIIRRQTDQELLTPDFLSRQHPGPSIACTEECASPPPKKPLDTAKAVAETEDKPVAPPRRKRKGKLRSSQSFDSALPPATLPQAPQSNREVPQRGKRDSDVDEHEILRQTQLRDLDTGEVFALSDAEKVLPIGVSPISLQMMARTRELTMDITSPLRRSATLSSAAMLRRRESPGDAGGRHANGRLRTASFHGKASTPIRRTKSHDTASPSSASKATKAKLKMKKMVKSFKDMAKEKMDDLASRTKQAANTASTLSEPLSASHASDGGSDEALRTLNPPSTKEEEKEKQAQDAHDLPHTVLSPHHTRSKSEGHPHGVPQSTPAASSKSDREEDDDDDDDEDGNRESDGSTEGTANQDSEREVSDSNQSTGLSRPGAARVVVSSNMQLGKGKPRKTTFKVSTGASRDRPRQFTVFNHVQSMASHSGPVWALRFSSCGRMLATAGQDKVIYVWVLKDFFEELHTMLVEERDDPAYTTRDFGSASEEDVFHPTPLCQFTGHTSDILDLQWSPSLHNGVLLSSSMDKSVRLWHLSKKEALVVFEHHDFVTALAFHPMNELYFLSGSIDTKIRIWSIQQRRVIMENEVAGGDGCLVAAACFCMRGKYVAAGTYDGRVVFFDTHNDLKYHTSLHMNIKGKSGSKISGLMTSAEGTFLLVTSNDSRLRLYNLSDYSLTCKFKGYVNTSSLIRASFSPNGQYIISASEDKKVFLWETERPIASYSKRIRRDKNSEYYSFAGHATSVTQAIATPEECARRQGSRIGIVSADITGELRIFFHL